MELLLKYLCKHDGRERYSWKDLVQRSPARKRDDSRSRGLLSSVCRFRGAEIAANLSAMPQNADKREKNAGDTCLHRQIQCRTECYSPTLVLPKKRPDFVDEDGGGGFWICEAVGARDWRMEYVRCMIGGCECEQGVAFVY